MQRALTKRGVTLNFDEAWKALRQDIAARIEERKPAAWDPLSEDEERFFRLILPLNAKTKKETFPVLTLNVFLQLAPGKILVWVVAVGGRMDVPYHLGKRNGVMVKGVEFTCTPQRFTPSE